MRERDTSIDTAFSFSTSPGLYMYKLRVWNKIVGMFINLRHHGVYNVDKIISYIKDQSLNLDHREFEFVNPTTLQCDHIMVDSAMDPAYGPDSPLTRVN
jgi:hypothetical protein